MSSASSHAAGLELVAEEFVDLAALWGAAWQRKFLILALTAAVGVAAVLVTLAMPDIYRSSALLTPVAQERPRGLGALGGNLSALAGLAGFNFGGAAVDNTTLGIQTLTSREFLTEFVKRHNLEVPLFAAQGWDFARRKWIVDPDIYDETNKTWIRKVEPPLEARPSDWEIFKAFSKMVSVEQDPKTSLVRVSVDTRSPEMSQEWAKLLVDDLNAHMRQRDLIEANRSISYLEQRLAQTDITEIRMAAIQLIEEQMKTVMLAEARPEYVFRVLDPAVVPMEKHGPKRALLCIISTLLGGLLVTAGVITYHFAVANKRKA